MIATQKEWTLDGGGTVFLVAVANLCGGAKFQVFGDDHYENLKFLEEVTNPPTRVQVDAEVARIKTEIAASEYQKSRVTEYPPIGDQLDALWKGGAEAEAMLAKIQAVKAKFPKV